MGIEWGGKPMGPGEALFWILLCLGLLVAAFLINR